MPRYFQRLRAASNNPWAATITMGVINVGLLGLSLGTNSIAGALVNAASSLGLISIVFYGITAAAAFWQQRGSLTANWSNALLGGLMPLIGVLFSGGVLVESVLSGAVTRPIIGYGFGSIALGALAAIYLHRIRKVSFFNPDHGAGPIRRFEGQTLP
jgi:hypothetical protein